MGAIREVSRYGVKGAAFVGFNVCLQVVLVEAGGLRPAIAAAISTAAMPLAGYLAMEEFVFPGADAPQSHLRRFGAYYAVNMSSKAANYLLFLGLLAVDVWYPIAYAIGAGVVFLASFAINRRVWFGEVTA